MTPWQPQWLATVGEARRDLWRGVEAQHRVATMRLADDLLEQEVLEQLLEAGKPPLPPSQRPSHYLLFTPFRYVSPWPSRFRRAEEAGAWYGADEAQTVAAELAYWRWRFFMDSDGLRGEQLVTEHTFFRARFTGRELDLTQPPWTAQRARWRDPADYGACHALASHVRALKPPVQSVRYESARREGAFCQVVFEAGALAMPRQHLQQTWICKITAQRVLWSHDADRLQFEMQ
jgi:hypothetical protein